MLEERGHLGSEMKGQERLKNCSRMNHLPLPER